MSHTYALLPVSKECFQEVKRYFEDIGYTHALHETDKGLCIDMHGVALVQDDAKSPYRENDDGSTSKA